MTSLFKKKWRLFPSSTFLQATKVFPLIKLTKLTSCFIFGDITLTVFGFLKYVLVAQSGWWHHQQSSFFNGSSGKCSSFMAYMERRRQMEDVYYTTQKRSFPLRICSVNVTKSAVSQFFVQCHSLYQLVYNKSSPTKILDHFYLGYIFLEVFYFFIALTKGGSAAFTRLC